MMVVSYNSERLRGVGGALQMMAPHSVANIVESCEKHQINISITMIRERSWRPATRKNMKNTYIIIPRAMISWCRGWKCDVGIADDTDVDAEVDDGDDEVSDDASVF